MSWWAWLVTGVILLIAEAGAPGTFFMVFFSLAALVVGALVGVDVLPELWHQWSTFAFLSIIFTVALRKRLVALLVIEKTPNSRNQFTGLKAKTCEPIEVHSTGKGEFQGVSWNFYNTGEEPLDTACEVEIVEREGLTLRVRRCDPDAA